MKDEDLKQADDQKTEFLNYLNLFSTSIINEFKLKNNSGNLQNNEARFFHLKTQKRPEIYCLECHRSGDLLMCDQCENTFHLFCIGLDSVPFGQWLCPQCVLATKTVLPAAEDWPNNLALVHSYVMLKTAKEEEKKQLLKQLEEVHEEKSAMQLRTTALKESLVMKLHEKCELLETCNSAKKILGVIKAFVHLVQSSQTY